MLIVGFVIVVFLFYNVKVWGLLLVIVVIFILVYIIFMVLVWYVYGVEDINKYFVMKLVGELCMLVDGWLWVYDVFVNNFFGLLGWFMDIVLNMIFFYLVFGFLFGSLVGGCFLIKLVF